MESTQLQYRRALKSHFDAVVYFFTKLDVEMISDLLDCDREYQGFSRHIFIRKLGDLFYDLQMLGDTKLLAMVDDDPLPVGGNFGVTFEGNNTALYMDVVFEVDDMGFITDIYELSDSVNIDSKFSKRHRVYIDQFVEQELDFSTDEDDDRLFGDDDDFLL